MYEKFRKEKIVEAKIQRLRNAMGVIDTIVTFQNGAWHARYGGCYRKFQDGADLEWDCEQSLFLQIWWEQSTRTGPAKSRDAQNEGGSCQSHAISHERGHLRGSRFARRTKEKRETARGRIWNRHTDQQPLLLISRAWNVHRSPMNTEQPTTQLESVSFVYVITWILFFIEYPLSPFHINEAGGTRDEARYVILSPIWSSCSKKLLERVLRIKRAPRIVLNAEWTTRTLTMLNELNWIPFLLRHIWIYVLYYFCSIFIVYWC